MTVPMDFDWNRFADPQICNSASVIAVRAAVPRNSSSTAYGRRLAPWPPFAVITDGKLHNLTGDAELFSTMAAPYGLDPYGNPVQQSPYYQPGVRPRRRKPGGFLRMFR